MKNESEVNMTIWDAVIHVINRGNFVYGELQIVAVRNLEMGWVQVYSLIFDENKVFGVMGIY